MKIDLHDFQKMDSYDSLNGLFTRKFIRNRHFDTDHNTVISPVDSLITEQGNLNKYSLLQIKGMEYSVKELLTEYADNVDKVIDGSYINFYLSPGDYHGYHAPASFRIKKLIHVPGKLYPVNIPSLRKRRNLFIENERVVLECESTGGSVLYLIFVGALNVGNMTFEFEPRLETNKKSKGIEVYEYENTWTEKGKCLGCFKMGSTVVLISQKDFLELKTTIGQKVKFGDIIAKVKTC